MLTPRRHAAATRQFAVSFTVLAAAAAGALSVAACGGGVGTIDATNQTGQQLAKRSDGTATGNGQTCSWEGTAIAQNAKTPAPSPYIVGANFPSLDGCNECSCSAQGIMCTMRACAPPNPGPVPVACRQDAKLCPDGSSVGRSGPSCEFDACPTTPKPCTEEAKRCSDGSYVARTGPACEFAACPTACGPAECGGPPPTYYQLCADGETAAGVECTRTKGVCSWKTGVCPPIPSPPPCTKEECGPAMGMPSYLCADGQTIAGPGACERTKGVCGYKVISCPPDGQACSADAKQCPDGSFVSRTLPGCAFAACP